MPKKITTADFIITAKEVHGDTYDYSLVEYKGSTQKVKILCHIHGEFLQTPSNHLRGQGCIACKHNNTRKTTEEFIEQAQSIHGNLYDYVNVLYKNINTKVEIICKKHGRFEQRPDVHLRGAGCNICKYEKRTSSTEAFKAKAKEVHGTLYDYSNSVYMFAKEKITIICPMHGEFLQSPDAHLIGKGCKKCTKKGGFSFEFFENNPEEKATPAILYVCRLHSDTEDFFKIGITTRTIKDRFRSIPYEYEIIYELPTTLYQAFMVEQKLLELLPPYYPFQYFDGITEARSTLNGLREKDLYELSLDLGF